MIINFFDDHREIIAGTTMKIFGNCSVAASIDSSEKEEAWKRRDHLVQSYGFHDLKVPNIVHSASVLNIKKDDLTQPADAFITNEHDTFIAVTTADCIPVFLYDPVDSVIAIVHSGRIGLRDHITENTINKMIQEFNVKSHNILIQIGPHICKNCYEVGKEVLEEFRIFEKNTKGFLNMQDILVSNLTKIGIGKHQIRISPYCTYCSKNNTQENLFFSYRNNDAKERMLSFIGFNS